MIPDLVLAVVAGVSGGLVAALTNRLRLGRGRRVVPLEVGQRIAEPDGREWQIVGRAIDVRVGHVPTLRVDLGLRSDPS